MAEEGLVLLSIQPRGLPGAHGVEPGFPCQWCVPRGCTAMSARFFGRTSGKEAGLYSLCRPRPALWIPAKSSSRRHVHFGESRPAVSHREHLLLAAALAECSPAGTAFPSATGTPLCPAAAHPASFSKGPLCILLPASLPALALHLSPKALGTACFPRMAMERCLVALACWQ